MPDPLSSTLPDGDLLRAAHRDPRLGPRLADAVARLTPAYREALTLHLDDELPVEEVADALRVSVPAARRRVGRAQAWVRSALGTDAMTSHARTTDPASPAR